MPIDRHHREYVCYEISEHSIFNHDKWQFDPIINVNSWTLEGNLAALKLQLSSGQDARLSVEFLSDDVLRFRFWRSDDFVENDSPMIVQHEWPGTNVKQTEQDGWVILESPTLKLRFQPESFAMEIHDANGHLLQRFYHYGPIKSFFPSYALGFQSRSVNERRLFASFELQADEHFFGLGEKYGSLDKRGYRIVNWQSDTTGNCWDRSYKNIPFFLSSQGYGMFIHDSHRIEYELGSESYTSYSFAVENEQLEYYFFNGPSFKKLLNLYTRLTGRAPVPPKWSFGLWMSRCFYENLEQVKNVADGMRSRGIPCDVIHIDPMWMRKGHYCDFEWDEEAFPQPKKWLQELREAGIKICLWEQPFVPINTDMYREGEANGCFVKNLKGQTYIITDFEIKPVAIVDFTNPKAVAWYQAKHRKLLEQGVSVFKPDMGEALPKDAVLHNGKTGAEMHNLYPLLYNKTVYEACKAYSEYNAVVWGRSGYAGSQRYPLNWSGDPFSTFNEMACVLRSGLCYGLSGVPFWSHDIGGFQGGKPSPELYVRWAQFGLLSSHSRAHGCQPREPWEYGEEAERIFKKFAELRYRLLPYLWMCAEEASTTGLPVIRAMVLEFQDDPTAACIDLQYMLGPYLLVAPVFNEEGNVQVYLPEGLWTDFWTDETLHGPVWLKRSVPLDTVPIFIRENSIIPMGPTMNYVGEKDWNPITLEVHVQDAGEIELPVGEGAKVRVLKSCEKLTMTASPLAADLNIKFHRIQKPERVHVKATSKDANGDEVAYKADWLYDESQLKLKVLVPAAEYGTNVVVEFS